MSKRSVDEPVNEEQQTQASEVLESLIRALVVIPEIRDARGLRHPLLNVLTIAVLGCMCGCDDAEALEDWGKKEADWLSDYLRLRHGTPSQDVFLRVFAALEPTLFRKAFHAWMHEVFSALGLVGQIAIDGQTHRRSADKVSGKKPLHMVHALLCETGLVLGQMATDEKSNEIVAIPALLDLLDLRGAMVSIDAMGTQTKIANKIVKGGGDYLLALKGNQSTLHTEVQQAFHEASDPRQRAVDEEPPPQVTLHTEVDTGHGRIETRTARVLTGFEPWVPAAERWPGLKALVEIASTRECTTTGQLQQESRYYIASQVLEAEKANKHVRAHWLVENALHWCLDMSFSQDNCRLRKENAAENFAVVRHFALNIIRSYKGDRYSVPRRRRLSDYRRDYRSKVLQAAVLNP